jgi:hypothetical protein
VGAIDYFIASNSRRGKVLAGHPSCRHGWLQIYSRISFTVVDVKMQACGFEYILYPGKA